MRDQILRFQESKDNPGEAWTWSRFARLAYLMDLDDHEGVKMKSCGIQSYRLAPSSPIRYHAGK